MEHASVPCKVFFSYDQVLIGGKPSKVICIMWKKDHGPKYLRYTDEHMCKKESNMKILGNMILSKDDNSTIEIKDTKIGKLSVLIFK